MMRKFAPLILFIAFLSCISGYLMSKPSLIGRIGINLFYKQYRFLKLWWQGALIVFFVLMLLLLLQAFIHRKLQRSKANIIYGIMILLAFIGFYFTWQDFHHTKTHRWLRERFHIGAYLFWLGWVIVSLFFFTQKKELKQ